jgi:DNA invertase Pin-like site-specific DNA recombinase
MTSPRTTTSRTATTPPRPRRATAPAPARAGRLLGYARVSSREQDPAGQVAVLRAAGVGARDVFTDKASGVLRERPGLDRLLLAALPGDTIVVTRVDRLGRSLADLVRLVDELADRQLGIWVVQQNIDSRTDTGRTMLILFGLLAESERAWMLERTRDGLAAPRDAGRVGGRPAVMTADKLTAARGLLATGTSAAAAAAAVGVGRSTLYRALAEQPPPDEQTPA